jgi:hypothetical protein
MGYPEKEELLEILRENFTHTLEKIRIQVIFDCSFSCEIL